MNNLPNPKRIVIIGGGTNTYIANHLALSAPSYGTTARDLRYLFSIHKDNKMKIDLCLTKMANPFESEIDTPEDISAFVDTLIADPDVRVIIFNAAIVDYKPIQITQEQKIRGEWHQTTLRDEHQLGKYSGRLSTSTNPEITLELTMQDKIINKIRKERKDIFLVTFKTTCGDTKEQQFIKGLNNLKASSSNIVFCNDVNPKRIEKLNTYLYSLAKAKEDLSFLKTNTILSSTSIQTILIKQRNT
jgi:hypothetical protein